MSKTVSWREREFTVLPHDAIWYEVPGLYIFAFRETGHQSDNLWRPVYVGQTTSFASRIPNHESCLAAVRVGATHVLALVEWQAATRATLERELIQEFQTVMNVQLR